MKIGFLVAMNDASHGLVVSGNLSKEFSSRVNSYYIDDTSLLPKSHRGLDLTIYVDCVSQEKYLEWPGDPVDTDNLVKCWPKLVKPRGYKFLEAYIKFNFSSMYNNQDPLSDYIRGVTTSINHMRELHGIDFGFLKDDSFSSRFLTFVRNNPEKFRAENYYKNFHLTLLSQGLVVF